MELDDLRDGTEHSATGNRSDTVALGIRTVGDDHPQGEDFLCLSNRGRGTVIAGLMRSDYAMEVLP